MLKMNRNQNGFSLILLPILLIVIAIIGFAVFRIMGSTKDQNDTQATNNQSTINQNTLRPTEQEKDIELQNFGLASLSEVLVTKDALRDFASNGLKGFYVFGDTLPGGRQNPNFEFASLKKSAEVLAAIDGIVVNIKEQTEVGITDSEVFIQPKEGSVWTVGYDHLVNLQVKKGDVVKAGKVLGNPAPQNNGSYRFEIQINKDVGDTTHVCPSTIVASSVKQQLLGDLKTMLEAWESQTGTELYNVAAQNPVGCVLPSLTPAQAEGR
jgi:murein DD-endopeptidase MepM/ murein hydrolase activator NlpD